MKSLKITTHSEVSVVDLHELTGLQAAVGGRIEILSLDAGNDMVINETGKIDRLPYNHIASVLTVVLEVGLAPGDVINGDVVIVGAPDPQDEDGAHRDFDPRILATLAHLGFPVPDPA